MPEESEEFLVVRVREGDVAEEQSWVYAWIDGAGAVVYVGATGLDPRTRVWLHLHDSDADIGRLAAGFDELAGTDLDVLAMRVPDEVSRAEVRDVLGARLADEGLLSQAAITDQLQLVLDPAPEAVELAERFLARLQSSQARVL